MEKVLIFEYDERSLEKLGRIYQLYSGIMEERGWDRKAACSRGCSSCCTCNVTLTSLETSLLVARLGREEQERMAGNLASRFPEKRYIPLLTTNGFARACLSDREVQDEENDPAWGRCPLLEEGLCTVYGNRPFGCRAMMSETQCNQAGYARMPPLVLTLNNIFLQYIEHLDSSGATGNLSDMLQFFLEVKTLDERDPGQKKKLAENLISKGKILPNSKIPVLMIPPKHREAAGLIIRQITALT